MVGSGWWWLVGAVRADSNKKNGDVPFFCVCFFGLLTFVFVFLVCLLLCLLLCFTLYGLFLVFKDGFFDTVVDVVL